MDLSALQFDVAHKLKKLKTNKTESPNPIAEAAIQAAKASSALQNFQNTGAGSSGNDKRKKDSKKVGIQLILKVSFILLAPFFADGETSWRRGVGGFVAQRLGRR